jgi:hypothetical protein
VSKVVAVSRSGFTSAARAKAKVFGIDAMTISKATKTKWIQWVASIDRIWIDVIGNTIVGVRSVNLVDNTINPTDYPNITSASISFQDAIGNSLGTVHDIFESEGVKPAFHESLTKADRQEDGLIRFGLRLAPGTTLRLPDGRTVGVEGIHYLVRQETETLSIPLRPGEYGAQSIATGQAVGRDWKVTVAWVEGSDSQPKMTLHLARASGDLPQGRYHLFAIGEPVPLP